MVGSKRGDGSALPLLAQSGMDAGLTRPESGSEQSGVARMENEGGPSNRGLAGRSLDATLAKLGIVRVPITTFEWNGYRYTNASDAIAAAERATRTT